MAKPTMPYCSQDNRQTTTIAAAAAHGHAELAVEAHATTPALEHVWQGVQEGAQAVRGRVLAHAQQAVQGAVQVVVPVVQVLVEVLVVAQNEIIEHTNNSRM